MNQSIITKYFPELTARQVWQIEHLEPVYREWNARINVISRQDIDNLSERHILHSLSIAKFVNFKPGTKIMDAGTGGGFPGIPLAIVFPDVHFHLVDSTAKKLKVVKEVVTTAGLINVTIEHTRLEEHSDKYDFIVSRAVASLSDMLRWTWKNIAVEGFNDIPNGIICLKGGDLIEEINGAESEKVSEDSGIRMKKCQKITTLINPLSKYFEEPYFKSKFIVHMNC